MARKIVGRSPGSCRTAMICERNCGEYAHIMMIPPRKPNESTDSAPCRDRLAIRNIVEPQGPTLTCKGFHVVYVIGQCIISSCTRSRLARFGVDGDMLGYKDNSNVHLHDEKINFSLPSS